MEDRDSGYSDLMALVEDLKRRDSHVAVGVLGDVGGADEVSDDGLTMAGLATVHEFGTTRPHKIEIPERAPIRKTLDRVDGNIQRIATRLLKKVVEGDLKRDQALGKLGLYIESQIRRTIQMGVDPPNASGTIRRKQSSKPLIDEGQLLNSYTHQVRQGRPEED